MSHRAGPGCSLTLSHSPGSRRGGCGGAGPPRSALPAAREGGGGRGPAGKVAPVVPAASTALAAAEQSGAKVGRSRGWMRWAPGAAQSPAGPRDGGTAPQTQRCDNAARTQSTGTHSPKHTPAHRTDSAHTHSPKPAAEHIHAGVQGSQAEGRPSTRPPSGVSARRPGAAHLGWAEKGRRPAAHRRPRRRSSRAAILRDRDRTGRDGEGQGGTGQGGPAAGAPRVPLPRLPTEGC